jgi:hypothetical protein
MATIVVRLILLAAASRVSYSSSTHRSGQHFDNGTSTECSKFSKTLPKVVVDHRCHLMHLDVQPKSLISHVHIPKTAGISIQRELAKVFPGANIASWEEYYSEFPRQWPAGQVVTMLRNPRAHVFSQFLECKYDEWGRMVTNFTAFPRTTSDELDFNVWLNTFSLNSISGEADDYGCYNPLNMQTRYLANERSEELRKDPKQRPFRHKHPVFPAHHAFGHHDVLPSPEKALINLVSSSWFGITELFHESLCLLQYQASNGKESDFLTACECKIDAHHESGISESHESHNVPEHDVNALSTSTKDTIDKLTGRDAFFYSHALGIFILRIRKMERDTGISVLCKDRLRMLREEVAYLPAALISIDCGSRIGACSS